MARARNIKPGLFKNELLGVADPLFTLLFEGLWVLADREGRLEDRPLRIKAEVFPYRDGLSVEDGLNWLQSNGFILRYKAGTGSFIQILNFGKHQSPHKNEVPSEIPAPDKNGVVSSKIGTDSDKAGTTRADCLNLIPDSLNPSTTLSGKPDVAKPSKKEAIEILEFLNAKTGRNYQPLPANLELIQARLKEASADDIRSVVAIKCRQWNADEKMSEYLRPATLFGRQKFAQYLGELSSAKPDQPEHLRGLSL